MYKRKKKKTARKTYNPQKNNVKRSDKNHRNIEVKELEYKNSESASFIDKAIVSMIMIFIMAEGMVGGYIEKLDMWRAGILCSLLLILLVKKEELFEHRKGLIVTFILVYGLFVTSFFLNGGGDYFAENFYQMFYTMAAAFIIACIYRMHIKADKDFESRIFLPLNLFFVINQFVVYKQITDYGYLLKEKWLVNNVLYEDLCSGLFGPYKTHELALFSMFVIVLDLKICLRNTGFKRAFMAVYIALMVLTDIYLSSRNDNGIMFILIPMILYIVLYNYIKERGKKVFTFNMIILYAMIILLAIVIIIPQTRYYFFTIFFNRLKRVLTNLSETSMGSSERLAIFANALRVPSTWMFGMGLGKRHWYQSGVMGFKHFGINSLSSFTVLGGLAFFIVCVILYIQLFTIKKEKRYLIINSVMLLFMTVYTVIFTSVQSIIWLGLSCMIVSSWRSEEKSDESEVNEGLVIFRQNKKVIVLIALLASLLFGGYRLKTGIDHWDEGVLAYEAASIRFEEMMDEYYQNIQEYVDRKAQLEAELEEFKNSREVFSEEDKRYIYDREIEIDNEKTKINSVVKPYRITEPQTVPRLIIKVAKYLIFGFAVGFIMAFGSIYFYFLVKKLSKKE